MYVLLCCIPQRYWLYTSYTYPDPFTLCVKGAGHKTSILAVLYYSAMGRHSTESKRAKRKIQKKRKKLAHEQAKLVRCSNSAGGSETTDSDSSMLSSPDQASSLDTNILSPETHPICEENCDRGSTLSLKSSTLPSRIHSGDKYMLSSIDDVVFENDEYWNEKIKEELRVYESYRDVHPSILTDASRTVTVFVDGTGPYKGTAGLRRVELEEYIGRLHKRDEKAVRLCRLLRDHLKHSRTL